MNKTAQTELHRLFLIDRLPDPLTAASSHLQIFDNYIENTRIRLRSIRDPYSNTWTRILQQRFAITDGETPITKFAEIHVNDAEYKAFERFKGREIRKNRYFHEFDRVSVAFDVYLGNQLGLNTAKIDFESREQMEIYTPPPFMVFEITNDQFFAGASLVTKSFFDVQNEIPKGVANANIDSDL